MSLVYLGELKSLQVVGSDILRKSETYLHVELNIHPRGERLQSHFRRFQVLLFSHLGLDSSGKYMLQVPASPAQMKSFHLIINTSVDIEKHFTLATGLAGVGAGTALCYGFNQRSALNSGPFGSVIGTRHRRWLDSRCLFYSKMVQSYLS